MWLDTISVQTDNPSGRDMGFLLLLGLVVTSIIAEALSRCYFTKNLPMKAHPAGGNFKLGWGLAGLDQLLSQADADSPLNLSVLESRLLDNLSDVRLYSSTETLRSEGALERARIGGKLKRLALDRVGSSLNDVF